MANQDDVKFIIAKRIREHADKWSWRYLSKNESITMDIIEENADLPWFTNQITMNPNLTWSFIIKHIEYYKNERWSWQYISAHKCVTIDIVKSYPDLPWDFGSLSRNISITIDDVLKNIEILWDWRNLSLNSSITWNDVQNHVDLPWCIDMMSGNPNITWDIIKKNPNINWDYKFFSMNVNFTNEILQNNPDVQFDRFHIFNTHYIQSCPWYYSIDLTWEMLNQYKIQDCIYLSPNLTWEIVRDNQDRPWDYSKLSLNQNITWEIVRDNQDRPWDYSKLSLNKNINWDIVRDNQDKPWDWERLSSNPSIFKLTDQDVCFISRVCYIQTRWRDALYNPKYAVCRRRILTEFNELGNI